MTQRVATELLVTVSMSDLMRWSNDNGETCYTAPSLLAALREADLNVDIRDLYFQYFDHIQVGFGDVYLYPSSGSSESLFAINLYRELTDQLDIISFGLICSRSEATVVATHLHKFLEEASAQISFEQSCQCERLYDLIDPKQHNLLIEEANHT